MASTRSKPEVVSPGAVVLVENDEPLRARIGDALRAAGLEVVPAPHGVEALRLVARPGRPWCVLLLDVLMPVIDVWRIIEALRPDDRLLTLPLVVETGAGVPTPSGTARLSKRVVALDALIAELHAIAARPR